MKTLLMNPGDRIRVQIFDADIGGGQHALETPPGVRTHLLQLPFL